jgi:uncharacterized small protein (DUF1192 family)
MRAAHARSDQGSKGIVRRLRAEAKAQGLELKEYIETLTKDPAGVTPAEGTAPTSAFWSYGIEHPDAPMNRWNQNFLDNRYIAEAWAKIQNDLQEGSAQTLETTEAGHRLNEMYLWEENVREALGGAGKGFTEEWARECWANLSETYAAAAKGPVAVFAQYADTRSILYNQELPTLHANANVGLDNIYFAYESPDSWPKEIRGEVGTNAARAQLQYNDPTKPHYVDPKVYATQNPTQRIAALDAEFAAVTAERNERAAKKRAAEQAATAESAAGQAPEETVERSAEAEAEPAAKTETEAQTEPEPQVETEFEAQVETHSEAQVDAQKQTPAPSASVPVWQLGFNPKPVINQAAASAPAAPSTAPPTPDLTKQATGPELG